MMTPSDLPPLTRVRHGVFWGGVPLVAPLEKKASHCLTRRFAKAYLALQNLPMDQVIYQDSGKPVFLRTPHFLSVTHTRTFFAFCAASVPCGIDAENAGRTCPAVARRFFSEAERAQDFATVWTAKEAVSKISGEGLSAVGRIRVDGDRAVFCDTAFSLQHLSAHGCIITVAVKE